MKWRTDTPTADVIVAVLKWLPYHFEILEYDKQLQKYVTESHLPICDNDIEKWADLEEDETVTDCDELEREIERYIAPIHADEIKYEPFTSIEECARHFAKWGAEHLKNKQK